MAAVVYRKENTLALSDTCTPQSCCCLPIGNKILHHPLAVCLDAWVKPNSCTMKMCSNNLRDVVRLDFPFKTFKWC